MTSWSLLNILFLAFLNLVFIYGATMYNVYIIIIHNLHMYRSTASIQTVMMRCFPCNTGRMVHTHDGNMLPFRLYCTVLCSPVLYCTILYCTVLYCTALYCCTILYCTVLYCTVLYYIVLYYITGIIARKRGKLLRLRTEHWR